MATQNPLEHHGTYPLPESQLDRFLMRLTIGYPDERRSAILLESSGAATGRRPAPVLDPAQVLALQERVDRCAPTDVVDYLMAIIAATRAPRLRLGASPRGAIGLFRAARALALVDGRDFLVPDDVARMAPVCLAHRVLPHGAAIASADAHDEAAAIIEEILRRTPVPV
jgi:MoxR-like ATPase